MGFHFSKKTKGLLGSALISTCVLVSFQNCNNFNAIKDSITSMTDSSSVSGAAKSSSEKTAADASISADVFGTPLVISTTTRLAGAIGSLTWNGKEFINQDDHGRELQSASSFDGFGECYNPTEAGSRTDHTGDTSTSKLLAINASGNKLATTVQMAFWTTAGDSYPGGCGNYPDIKVAQNTTDLSEHTISKQVNIGFAGIPNVIEYLVTYHVPEHHDSATFEALTGYLTRDFSSFWTFDPASGALNTLSDGPGEQTIPVILSTVDQNYAMGIYSPDLPQQDLPWGYGRFNFYNAGTMKWNAVFRRVDTPAGDYSFRMYVVVGSLTQVTQGMTSVHQHFQKDVMGNIDGFSQDANGQTYLNGWACARYMDDPISVHMYLNGVAGTGQFYQSYSSNLSSEAAVAQTCQNNGANYRFSIPISNDMMSTYSGQKIYIHGISPVERANLTISNSGNFSVPSLATKPAKKENFRFYSPYKIEHFITLSYDEGVAAGYEYEGVAFKTFVSSENVPGAVEIYRCFWSSVGLHFVSTDYYCENNVGEGSLGFIYSSQTLNSVPLYRFLSPSNNNHLTTTNYAEGIAAGYKLEGILGYVPTD